MLFCFRILNTEHVKEKTLALNTLLWKKKILFDLAAEADIPFKFWLKGSELSGRAVGACRLHRPMYHEFIISAKFALKTQERTKKLDTKYFTWSTDGFVTLPKVICVNLV